MKKKIHEKHDNEKNHLRIQKTLEQRLKKYGYKTYNNVEYFDFNLKRVIGEIDILAIKTDDEERIVSLRFYEVKSGKYEYYHAKQQLRRAREYFTPNKHELEPKLVYVSERSDGSIIARRVR